MMKSYQIKERLFNLLSLSYDPTPFDFGHPFRERQKPKAKSDTSDWEQVNNTTQFTKTVGDQDWKVAADTKVVDAEERNPTITEADEAIIKREKLKRVKYKNIKEKWAEGKGIILISKAIKEKGYSEKVVERYVKWINEANNSNSSPPNEEESTVQKPS